MKKLSELKRLITDKEQWDKFLNSERARKTMAAILLASSAIIIIWIIIFKCNNNAALHIQDNLEKTLWERFTFRLEPFTDLRYMIRSGNFDSLEFLAFIFNVVCFAPLAVCLSFFMKDGWNVLSLFLFSASAEVFQLFSCFGGFDPTDIFLNTLGAFLGCLLMKHIRKHMSEKAMSATMLVLTPPVSIWAMVAVVLTIINFPI